MEPNRVLSALFTLAVFCFFLPFVGVSCQGQSVARFTGMQSAMGTTVDAPQGFGGQESRQVPGDALAMAALLIGVAGLVASLAGAAKLAGAVGATAAAVLLVFKSRTDNSILRESAGMLRADYDFGFWGALSLYAAAAVLALMALQKHRSPTAPVEHTADVSGHEQT